MIVCSLPELLPYVDNGLYFALEKSDFGPNVLGCFDGPYRAHAKIKPKRQSAQSKGGRHSQSFDNLCELLNNDYGMVSESSPHGQTRATIQGPLGNHYTFLVREAWPVKGGLRSSRAGIALEKASRLWDDPHSMDYGNGEAYERGILIAHRASKENPGYVDVWLAYEWRATDGSSFIAADRCAHLGSIWFGEKPEMRIDDTGAEVDLD